MQYKTMREKEADNGEKISTCTVENSPNCRVETD